MSPFSGACSANAGCLLIWSLLSPRRRFDSPLAIGLTMLISTMNDLPGYEVTEVLGEVFGLTVRSRNAVSQLGSQLRSVFGGELKGMTQALTDSRNQVIERMVEEAQLKGGDAILAMRFDTSELGSTWTEICAYGTAVKIRKL